MPGIITQELSLRVPLEKVFAFFSDASNLEKITPPELRFRILSPLPIKMNVGTRLQYSLRLYGISFHWESLISEWVPDKRFVDEQIRGPYRRWVHLHEFESDGDMTVIRDRVEYELPMEPISRLFQPLVRRQLERIFQFRRHTIMQLFEPIDSPQVPH